MHRRSRARQIENHLKTRYHEMTGLLDNQVNEMESWMIKKWLYIINRAAEEIVKTEDSLPFIQKSIT